MRWQGAAFPASILSRCSVVDPHDSAGIGSRSRAPWRAGGARSHHGRADRVENGGGRRGSRHSPALRDAAARCPRYESDTDRTTTEALVPPPRIQRHRYFGVLARTAASGQIGWRGRMSPTGRCKTLVNARVRLRAQPVDATPSILIDKGLKSMALLRPGFATIRGCTSTSERDQETAQLAISTDLTSTCRCVS